MFAGPSSLHDKDARHEALRLRFPGFCVGSSGIGLGLALRITPKHLHWSGCTSDSTCRGCTSSLALVTRWLGLDLRNLSKRIVAD